jgi:hypothetical protein
LVGVVRRASYALHCFSHSLPVRSSDNAPIHFTWTEDWYCTGCDGVEALLVSTDPTLQNPVISAGGQCPASSSPSCPTAYDGGPLPAGTYYWAVGVKLGDNPGHVSDEWSFTVVAGAAPPPPPAAATFTDATGDAGTAPDIGTVTISNDANGQLAIQIGVTNEPDLAPDAHVAIFAGHRPESRNGAGRHRGRRLPDRHREARTPTSSPSGTAPTSSTSRRRRRRSRIRTAPRSRSTGTTSAAPA